MIPKMTTEALTNLITLQSNTVKEVGNNLYACRLALDTAEWTQAQLEDTATCDQINAICRQISDCQERLQTLLRASRVALVR